MTVTCDVLIDDRRWSERFDVEPLVNSVVAKALEITKARLHPGAEASFSFVDDSRIRELNREWRDKDSATNVLSFPAAQPMRLEMSPLLGDVVLAYETIDREAAEEGKLFMHHTAHMIVHGFLHLLGFDHQEEAEACEMEGAESRVLVGMGMPDPWASREPGMTVGD